MDTRIRNKLKPVIEEHALGRLAGMIALSMSLLVCPTAAVGAEGDESASTAAASAAEEMSDDAELMVERMMEEWLEEGTGRAIRESGSLNVVQGTSLVKLRVDDKRWGKARSLAFQDAFVQAMGDYVKSARQRSSVSLIREYFEEDIPESQLIYQEGEPADSYLERVVVKSAALAEQTLDQALAESGMSDDEIRRLSTPVQKRVALRDSISRRTLTEAVGSAAGLIPVKTFEGVDDEGNSAIGVVAVYSERMRHIASRISRGDVVRPDPDRVRGTIMSQIDSYGEDKLPNEFGVRIMWDEQGYPAIVSFGQWGWSPANLSKRKRAQRRKFARKQAANDALSNLTVFIKASTRFTDEGNVGRDVEEAVNLSGDDLAEEVEEVEIVDRLVETAKIRAQVDLTGYTRERSWSTRHPLLEEHEIVGVVAYWSPSREDAIRTTIGKEPKHPPPVEASRKPERKQVSGGSAQSRDPDPADF